MTNYAGKNWDNAMFGLYKNFSQKEQKDSELTQIFINLRKLLEKKKLNHWHIHSFERYMRNNINPFGLRIQIFPTMEHVDPSFKQAWENNLSACSENMMSLLIEEYRKTIQQIDKELESLYTQLTPFKTHTSFVQLDNELNAHLEQFNKNILIKKENKFLRDQTAFSEHKAYNWKTSQTKAKFNSTIKPFNNDSTLSDASSMSSYSFKGQAGSSRSRKSKRGSNGSGSNGKHPKKCITEIHNTSAHYQGPQVAQGKNPQIKNLIPTDANPLLPRSVTSGNTASLPTTTPEGTGAIGFNITESQ